MIELIERLINFKARYDVNGTFSIFTNEDKTDTFIIIRLDKNGYRVARCIEYKQWLSLSNMQKDFELSNMIRSLDTKTTHNKGIIEFLYSDTDSCKESKIYSDFNKKQEV